MKRRLGKKAYIEVVDKAPDDFWRALPRMAMGGNMEKVNPK